MITKQKVVETQAELLVVAKDKVESTKKNGWKQSFKVMDVNGKALTGKDYDAKNAKYYLVAEGEDVELTSTSQVPAGSEVKVVVNLQGASYEGTATGTYRILKAGHDISKAKITLVEQKYTGSEIYIDGNEDIKSATLKVDKKTSLTLKFKEEGDPDVAPEGYGYVEVVKGSYEKNVNKGTAKVTLKGAGELGGEKTVTFKIGTRNVVDNWCEELMKSRWF